MLTTNLKPAFDNETWQWAVRNGSWQTRRGHRVLCLGAADYVLNPVMDLDDDNPPLIFSVNGDPGVPEHLPGSSQPGVPRVPFGLRWAITRRDIDNDSHGTALDRLAVEQFRLAGLIR